MRRKPNPSGRGDANKSPADEPPPSEKIRFSVERLLVRERVAKVFGDWLKRQEPVTRDLMEALYVEGLSEEEACARVVSRHGLGAFGSGGAQASRDVLEMMRSKKTSALNQFRRVLHRWMRDHGVPRWDML